MSIDVALYRLLFERPFREAFLREDYHALGLSLVRQGRKAEALETETVA